MGIVLALLFCAIVAMLLYGLGVVKHPKKFLLRVSRWFGLLLAGAFIHAVIVVGMIDDVPTPVLAYPIAAVIVLYLYYVVGSLAGFYLAKKIDVLIIRRHRENA